MGVIKTAQPHSWLANKYTVLSKRIRGGAMTPNNIQSIDIKLQQLKNRRALLLAQHGATERKRITRQAVIIGKWVMAKRPELVTEITGMLERDQDRAVFKMPPAAAAGQVAPGISHVDIQLPLDDDAEPTTIS